MNQLLYQSAPRDTLVGRGDERCMVLQALQRLNSPLASVRPSLALTLDPTLAERSQRMMRQELQEADRALSILQVLCETLEASTSESEPEAVSLTGAIQSGEVQ
jgi:hypothetical protein